MVRPQEAASAMEPRRFDLGQHWYIRASPMLRSQEAVSAMGPRGASSSARAALVDSEHSQAEANRGNVCIGLTGRVLLSPGQRM